MLGVLTVTTTSCEDWLTTYPQNRVVEEQFWEDKNDLEGVRYAAYKQMCSTISDFAVWGDLRSDSYVLNPTRHSDQENRDTYEEIMQGMPDSSMSQFEWDGVYKTINFCNKVLQHGAEVLARDKQFTTAEWQQMRAEITALRALNYFYLIRAFKDIPYTTKVINNDTEVEKFGLTNQLVVLDSIILDCERVAGQARVRFTSLRDTKGMITNSAIYAMLADMYLWRASLRQGRFGKTATDTVMADTGAVAHSVMGDYQLCSDYADKALASLARQNEEANRGYGRTLLETKNYKLPNCDMIANEFEGANQNTQPQLIAQANIFAGSYSIGSDVGDLIGQNSYESIFELQFDGGDIRENKMVNSLYGQSNGTHLAVSQDAIGAIYDGAGTDDYLFDTRTWFAAQNRIRPRGSSGSSSTLSGWYCVKYMRPAPELSEGASKEVTVYTTSYAYNNWIIYRMTDVMLMKAEAKACLGTRTDVEECLEYTNAVHRRSYCDYKNGIAVSEDVTTTPTTWKKGDAIRTGTDYVKMVMNERQIELIGEGKRWFDLVRWAERNADSTKETADERESTDEQFVGNGQTGVELMVETFMQKTYAKLYKVLKNRFKNRYGLYCPIYYMEVKASDGKITQNPVWNKSKYDN